MTHLRRRLVGMHPQAFQPIEKRRSKVVLRSTIPIRLTKTTKQNSKQELNQTLQLRIFWIYSNLKPWRLFFVKKISKKSPSYLDPMDNSSFLISSCSRKPRLQCEVNVSGSVFHVVNSLQSEEIHSHVPGYDGSPCVGDGHPIRKMMGIQKNG